MVYEHGDILHYDQSIAYPGRIIKIINERKSLNSDGEQFHHYQQNEQKIKYLDLF